MDTTHGTDFVLTDSTRKLIRYKARQLGRRRDFRHREWEDLEQDLWLALIQQAHHFDPTRASLPTFIDQVIRTAVAMIIRHQRAIKRTHERSLRSLDQPQSKSRDGATSLGQGLAQDAAHRHRQTCDHEPISEWERHEDRGAILARLPPQLRLRCYQLMHDSPTAVARETGVSRRSIRHDIDAIREYFTTSGLEPE